ncbi:uncharacterized protein LOC134182053 [Corticium candelabrum]|uniref:uncharacterized protein LOC134182053 n=1 Tax=Corticium candelabrum TaxID=121492 RepID=UPI002E2765E3|nr:uncharacterized protein LOC134182053 [Corticium candelabrum]
MDVDSASSHRRLTLSTVRGVKARRGLSLDFVDVSVDVSEKEKEILHAVSGGVEPGEMLAIMGPSGAGKTTLLNVLAGRLKSAYNYTGQINVDGEPLNKQLRRKVSYVLQADVFFSYLTLKQALTYSALLRLPSSMSKRDKLRMVDRAIEVLGVQDCQNTIFGNAFYSGLSGGEKKRANIACELLTDPAILMLDEPTSGLDSSTALSLLKTLRHLAIDEAKTLIATIHQPSTQCYYEFDKLLLLCEGKVAYCGPTGKVVDYFSSIGFECPAHYNPADYALDLVTGSESQQRELTESWKERKGIFSSTIFANQPLDVIIKEPMTHQTQQQESSTNNLSNGDIPTNQLFSESSNNQLRRQDSYSEAINAVVTDVECDTAKYEVTENHKFPTSFWTQLSVLSQRSFYQAKPDILSKLGFIQNIIIGLIAGFIWFQISSDEKNIRDRAAFFFFQSGYWGFQPVGQASLAFSQEKAVVQKERAAGSYRLSAYYISKCFSEIPLILVLPFIEFTIAYYMAGMHGADRWILSFFILIISSFAAQSLGLFVGSLLSNLKEALTAGVIAMLTSLLIGGFYVTNFPPWLQWVKYLSLITYTWDALLSLEFMGSSPFRCDHVISSYSVCENITATNGSHYLITGDDVLQSFDVALRPWQSVMCLLLYSLIFRILTYLALRYLHKPK